MPPRETSRDYARPYRPWPIRAFNTIGRARPLELEPLLAEATRKAGDRFATEAFREPLRRLLDSLNAEARLSPMGRFMTAQHVVSALTTNLRAGALFAARPDLARRPLPRVILVCGLGRSGTTVLQRMLAQLPGARALPAWEVYDPIPAPGPARPGREDPRIAAQRTASRFLRWMSPDLFAAHPMDALAPEEDVLLLETVFMSSVPESTYRVPSFAAWLEQQDQAPAYRWLADCIRAMSEREDGAFWVLKAPHHLGCLDVVFDVFPDVTVVQTHRDPVVTVPSFCSLVAHGWGVMSDHVDPREVGAHWSRKIANMLDRALATRDARAGRGFVDVAYADLARDPVGAVERVATALGLDFPATTREQLTRWHAEHPRHENGVHRYAAEDFGLDPGALGERFRAYRERFGVAEA